MSARPLRTAAWYGDRALELRFPDGWQVRTLWPRTPPPLSEPDIAAALERPVGQPAIRDLARESSRPMVIVDDLTRPTPVASVLPPVLTQFADAGIPAERVTIMMATGAHGLAPRSAIERKVGTEAARSCRLVSHDHRGDVVAVGRTSFGTPVLVNREVRESDLLVGIGGIYPQHSTGFGGGSKLALGVLATRSIAALHHGHPSMHGSYEIENDFRRDLDEVARLIGLETTISVQIDADRQPVRIACGDAAVYYREEVAFARSTYSAPAPGEADVVISNAYPIDVSLTFMRSKGIIPLLHARPRASRLIVSACPEGVGHHALFPFMNKPRFARQRRWARVAANAPGSVPAKVIRRARRAVAGTPRRGSGAELERANPIWLYPPGDHSDRLPERIPGMTVVASWERALETVRVEQAGREELDVVVYPCAPLHVIDLPRANGDAAQSEMAGLE